jgi:4-hydroxybenzoate polyprenyltransferase
MLGLLGIAGVLAGLGFFYWLALFGGGLLFLYQQWLIREREPDGCFRGFLNNNWFGMTIFCGIAADYYAGALT